MVNKKLCIYSEQTVENILICSGYITHSHDSYASKPLGRSCTNPPKICKRSVVPKCFPIKPLVQIAYVILHMLCCNVQGYLGQVKVGAYSAGSSNSYVSPYILHNLYG
jgi:hypothetical protein